VNRVFLLLLFIPLGQMTEAQTQRPNFLIIMADDCTYNDLPLYGGQNARTPNIDRLAKQGLTFNRAYLAEAMCQPCRAELMTGQYPLHNGCAWNHSASRTNVKSIPHRLGSLGYRTGIAGKVHVKPASAFPFENVGGFDPNCVRNPTRIHELDGIRDFMSRDDKQPFCLVVALVEPHVPWVMGDSSQYPPASLKLPPNIADTPRTRQDFAKYLAEITYMDSQVGQVLETLNATSGSDNTLVFFTSEQGSQFPGNKWTNWNTGIQTALVACWPEHIAADKRTDALVQYADILPTLVDLAGGKPGAHSYDGTSFRDVLFGKKQVHRQFVYGMHNNIPEGPPYPIRSVNDGEYHYIRNLLPNEIYIEKHLMGIRGNGALNNPYWGTWIWDSWKTPRSYRLVKRYMHRPAEQLYRVTDDPYEMNNLISDETKAKHLAKLRAELDRWMKVQNDPGAAVDTPEAIQASKRGEHLHGTLANQSVK
jgi:N-sulfoglucosamine sulfohydrolase